MTTLNQLWHLTEKESQKQSANMATIHIRIGHDDNFMVANFVRIVFVRSNACTQSGNQRPHLST